MNAKYIILSKNPKQHILIIDIVIDSMPRQFFIDDYSNKKIGLVNRTDLESSELSGIAWLLKTVGPITAEKNFMM